MRELTLAEMVYNSHPCTCAFETWDGEVHASNYLYSARYAAKLRHFSGDCKLGNAEIHVMGG